MKLELTEDEVKEYVLVGINKRFGCVFNNVELDCHYGTFNKAILTFEDVEDESKEIQND